ncbi:hypothetical protein KOW79_018084 [Hemibagrus wyckioides]|uniref:Uncharacterized protein n=1 Tax=Hemibagrus wyckioides TaxID=337641 RepID=A0A9D3NBH1_9TELE|nr:hypothetical protein KOW79_018084 [Hemibagrus wyckioides]
MFSETVSASCSSPLNWPYLLAQSSPLLSRYSGVSSSNLARSLVVTTRALEKKKKKRAFTEVGFSSFINKYFVNRGKLSAERGISSDFSQLEGQLSTSVSTQALLCGSTGQLTDFFLELKQGRNRQLGCFSHQHGEKGEMLECRSHQATAMIYHQTAQYLTAAAGQEASPQAHVVCKIPLHSAFLSTLNMTG